MEVDNIIFVRLIHLITQEIRHGDYYSLIGTLITLKTSAATLMFLIGNRISKLSSVYIYIYMYKRAREISLKIHHLYTLAPPGTHCPKQLYFNYITAADRVESLATDAAIRLFGAAVCTLGSRWSEKLRGRSQKSSCRSCGTPRRLSKIPSPNTKFRARRWGGTRDDFSSVHQPYYWSGFRPNLSNVKPLG